MQNFPKREGGMVELTISNLLVSQFGSTSGASCIYSNFSPSEIHLIRTGNLLTIRKFPATIVVGYPFQKRRPSPRKKVEGSSASVCEIKGYATELST